MVCCAVLCSAALSCGEQSTVSSRGGLRRTHCLLRLARLCRPIPVRLQPPREVDRGSGGLLMNACSTCAQSIPRSVCGALRSEAVRSRDATQGRKTIVVRSDSAVLSAVLWCAVHCSCAEGRGTWSVAAALCRVRHTVEHGTAHWLHRIFFGLGCGAPANDLATFLPTSQAEQSRTQLNLATLTHLSPQSPLTRATERSV